MGHTCSSPPSTGLATIVRSILRELPGSDPSKTTPRDELIATLQERVTEPTVVVLDEGDDLPETDILDVLRCVPDMSWIAICHDDIDWLSRVDESIRHGLTDRSPQLDKFTTGELTDILDARQRVGLEGGVISRGQLRTLADDAAEIARRGIFALRAAAELAEERGHSTIEDIDVADSFARARRQLREQALESLLFHHLVLYEIIRRKGRIRTAAVNDRMMRLQLLPTMAATRRRSRSENGERSSRNSLRTTSPIVMARDRGGSTGHAIRRSHRHLT
ncbi:orc1/cdc6 family replication initiation protein [Haloarcula sebkhae]|uniref:Orc1/cdc6 family replication initiation protein n=1 Tax=Haloarcula sebkhae TaxID=932660 RepID=A0ACC6VRW2_9EURY|nr:orc1/cdc6 family replication initiation protein [Haloarcula sebkhae]